LCCDGVNDYEKATKSVLGMWSSQYVHDYPVFGFGANYVGVVRHYFHGRMSYFFLSNTIDGGITSAVDAKGNGIIGIVDAKRGKMVPLRL
jgi:hypothetical protein